MNPGKNGARAKETERGERGRARKRKRERTAECDYGGVISFARRVVASGFTLIKRNN